MCNYAAPVTPTILVMDIQIFYTFKLWHLENVPYCVQSFRHMYKILLSSENAFIQKHDFTLHPTAPDFFLTEVQPGTTRYTLLTID